MSPATALPKSRFVASMISDSSDPAGYASGMASELRDIGPPTGEEDLRREESPRFVLQTKVVVSVNFLLLCGSPRRAFFLGAVYGTVHLGV
jgi:hypothetical protein